MAEVLKICRRPNRVLMYWINFNGLLLFCALICILVGRLSSIVDVLNVVIMFNAFFCIILLGQFRLKSLEFNVPAGRIVLIMDKFLFFKKRVELPISAVDITFKKEHQARGIMAKVFKIYCSNKLITEVTPGLSGFSEKSLTEVCELKDKLLNSTHQDQLR